jgi:hypothetical protein
VNKEAMGRSNGEKQWGEAMGRSNGEKQWGEAMGRSNGFTSSYVINFFTKLYNE